MERRVELVRQQWEDSYRKLVREPGIDAGVREQVETVTSELRRRIGSSFTLGELADAYDASDRWALTAIAERCERPGWVRTAASAADAAFHLYARGARDYEP
jgi:hypothetical protein